MKKLGLTILTILLSAELLFAVNAIIESKPIALTIKKAISNKAPSRNPRPTVTVIPIEAFIENDIIIVRFIQEIDGDGTIIIKDEMGMVIYEECVTTQGEYMIEMDEGWSEIEIEMNGEWYWGVF